MAACERCWRDAHTGPSADVSANYARLLIERSGSAACTPEEQAGDAATECKICGRCTGHQHARICMVCSTSDEVSR